MAQAATEASSVRKGLADRMKPRTAQSTGGGTNYASRFQNPGAGTNVSRTVDRSRFQPSGGSVTAPARPRSQAQAAPQPARPAPTTATAGAPPTTPGRPGGRFGPWTPRAAAPVYPRQAAPPIQPMRARPAMPMPTVAQPMPQQVPGQYQTPGRPMAPTPTMATPAPMPTPQPMPGTMAAPTPEPPQQEMARLQQRLAQLQQQMYNPTLYPGR